ncbi:transcription factor [Basidiobolus ranarum]|uniref:Transcription factor n=1 Tax=Basidiobolus ranarum TaxID=34480 RepID=A0ABR2W0Y4_9FUNG
MQQFPEFIGFAHEVMSLPSYSRESSVTSDCSFSSLPSTPVTEMFPFEIPFQSHNPQRNCAYTPKGLVLEPDFTYASLITQAILNSPEQRLLLQDIYAYIKQHYTYYQYCSKQWQNSIRHNLSLHRAFDQLPKEKGTPGKGSYWIVKEDYQKFFKNGQLDIPKGYDLEKKHDKENISDLKNESNSDQHDDHIEKSPKKDSEETHCLEGKKSIKKASEEFDTPKSQKTYKMSTKKRSIGHNSGSRIKAMPYSRIVQLPLTPIQTSGQPATPIQKNPLSLANSSGSNRPGTLIDLNSETNHFTPELVNTQSFYNGQLFTPSNSFTEADNSFYSGCDPNAVLDLLGNDMPDNFNLDSPCTPTMIEPLLCDSNIVNWTPSKSNSVDMMFTNDQFQDYQMLNQGFNSEPEMNLYYNDSASDNCLSQSSAYSLPLTDHLNFAECGKNPFFQCYSDNQ